MTTRVHGPYMVKYEKRNDGWYIEVYYEGELTNVHYVADGAKLNQVLQVVNG